MKSFLALIFFTVLLSQQVTLTISDSGDDYVEIYMVNSAAVGGFQFTLTDTPEAFSVSGASGGSAGAAGFMMSTNADGLVLGFSLTAGSIPPGSGVLMSLAINPSGLYSQLDLDVANIAGTDGSPLTYQVVNTPYAWGTLPYVSISSPTEGEEITSQNINVSLGTANLVPGDHFHAYIDGTQAGMYYSNNFTLPGLTVGEHELTVIVADADHNEYTNPEATDTVNFGYYPENPLTHFIINIAPTGEAHLIVFQNSISSLEPGDEIGVFDQNAILNSGNCSTEYGELLVGAGQWTGEQLEMSAIGSVDYCSFGGDQQPGYVTGDEIVIRIYKPSTDMEYTTEIELLNGDGIFGELLTAVSELNLINPGCTDPSACNYNPLAQDDDGSCLYDDCNGDCGGGAVIDECGACCDGNTETECSYYVDQVTFGGAYDCAGVCFGESVVDDCEDCVLPDDFNAAMDCLGICGGEMVVDDCGVCDGGNADKDCSGECFGTAYENECGCVGGSTGLAENYCYGCMDLTAYNYNIEAIIDDGSCLYHTLGDVVINELMIWPSNPTYGEIFSEYIELTNISDAPVDLEGWSISTNSGSALISAVLMEPGAYALLAITDNPALNLGLEVDYAWGFGTGVELANTTDHVILSDSAGNIVDDVAYDLALWPVVQGASIELNNPLMINNLSENWSPGSTPYDSEGNLGTPRTENDALVAAAGIAFSPAAGDFGPVWLGASDTMSVEITNIGESDLVIDTFYADPPEIDGQPVFSFNLPETPLTLPPGAAAAFSVVFNALADETFETALTVLSNAAGSEAANYFISGRGGLPALELLTPELWADSVYVPDYSDVWAQFVNTGGYPLILGDAVFTQNPSNFELLSELPFTVGPESSDSLQIRFAPTAPYSVQDTLTLTANDPDQPVVQIALGGYGLMPVISVAEDTLTFPTIHSDQSLELNLTVSNTGNGNLQLTNWTTDSPWFSADYDGAPIAPGSSGTLTVTFTPAFVGSYSGTLTLLSNDPLTDQIAVALSANAITPTIVFIPLDSPTIQGGIELAEDGDTVLVAAGLYYENINTLGKAITVMSETGADNTVIDSGGIFGNGSDGDVVVAAGDTLYTDTVRSAVTGANPPGQNELQLENAAGFAVGDEVLIISMGQNEENEAANLTGQYETRRIRAISGNTLSLDLPLTFDYSVAYADTFQGVFNTYSNDYWSTDNYNYTYGYDVVFYEKVNITKLKFFAGWDENINSTWSLWRRDGTLVYQETVNNGNLTYQWMSVAPAQTLILDPGDYRISLYVQDDYVLFREGGWNGYGGYYQSFRHGVVEFTYSGDGNTFPQNSFTWFQDRAPMVDFEYELAEPVTKHQVLRIPNYASLQNEGLITAHNWDGKTGGIVYFRVAGQLQNDGSIDVSGKGYRGGNGKENYQYESWGWRGEGIYGVAEGPCNNGQFYYMDIRNARLDAGGGAEPYRNGAGGGGYGTPGNDGYPYNQFGYGGSAVGNPQLDKMYFGGGGGSGGVSGAYDSEVRKKGGTGGGILAIFSSLLQNNGQIGADGLPGENYAGNNDLAGGGAGAGGTLWLTTANFSNTGQLTARKGDCIYGWAQGGDGGVGRIRLDLTEGDEGTVEPPVGFYGELSVANSPTLILNNAEGYNTIFEGFSLRGYQTLSLTNVSPTIRNCTLIANGQQTANRTAVFQHLLLEVTGGSPQFVNVTFADQTLAYPGAEGSGTWVTLAADSVVFSSCSFENLQTQVNGSAAYRRGNVVYQSAGSASFEDCSFTGNQLSGTSAVQSELKGGVYYLAAGEARFDGCTFSGNHLTGVDSTPKGGVFYLENGTLSLENCVVDSNWVSSNLEVQGAFLYAENPLTVSLGNTDIVAANGGSEVLRLAQGGSLELNGVSIGAHNSDGIVSPPGGSLTLQLTDVELSANAGDAVRADGPKFLNNVTISGNSGRGIYGSGEVELHNCAIDDNTQGGLLNFTGYLTADSTGFTGNGNDAIQGSGSVNLSAVTIEDNSADGIEVSGAKTLNLVTITGNSGRGIYGSGSINLSAVTVSGNGSQGISAFTTGLTALRSTISGNGSRGLTTQSPVTVELESCHLDSNGTAAVGSAIYLPFNSNAGLNDVTLHHNLGADGAGIFIAGQLSAVNSHITDNYAPGDGGGIHVDGTLELDSCEVVLNRSSGHGGGIYGDGTLELFNSALNDNTSQADGGGLWWGSGQVTVERSDLRRNQANRGGGAFILAENPIFQFDVVALNDATTIGGGLYISKASQVSSTPILFNSTVVYNTSAVLGSGLLCTYQTNPVVQNAIFWGNLAADGVQIHLQGGSEIFVTYSDIAGGSSGIVGFDDIILQHNIDQFPDFTAADAEDFHLQITSPCIDAGNPNAPLDPDGTVPDMGAYYFAQDGIPNIECQLGTLEFGGVPLASGSAEPLTLYNAGLSDLAVSGLQITPSQFTTADSAFVIPSMGSHEVIINFSPDAEGIYDGSVTFFSNDPDEGAFSVDLHGAGDGLSINTVTDIPADQGGALGIAWHRNVFDGIDDSETILLYNIWRRFDLGRNEQPHGDLRIFTPPGSNRSATWELVGSTPAMDFEDYAFTAPTLEDSTSAGLPWSVFLISAHTADPDLFYVSQPDSGYSVDNLPPYQPRNLAYDYQPAQQVALHWNPASEPDVYFYTIFRDGEALAGTADTAWVDTAIPAEFSLEYYVQATDLHENVSLPSESVIITEGMLGDLEMDGEINVLDVVILAYVLLNNEYTEFQAWAGDIDGDGSLSVVDLVDLIAISLGIDYARYGKPTWARLSVGNGRFELESDGDIAGLQLGFEGSIELEPGNLPAGWQLQIGEGIMLLYSSDGSTLRTGELFTYSGELSLLSVTLADWNGRRVPAEVLIIPDEYSLQAAYPNPFNPVTTLRYGLPEKAAVSITIYNMQGRIVRKLVNEQQSAGMHQVEWNAGEQASGVYFVVLHAGNFTARQKLMVVK